MTELHRESLNQLNFATISTKTLKSTQTDTPGYANINNNFHTYSKILKKNIRLAKKFYYHQLFEKYKFDMKNTWRIIKEALSKLKNKKKFPDQFKFEGKLITDKYVIASNFNDFFVNIGPTLSLKIKPDPKASYKDFFLIKQIMYLISKLLIEQTFF